MLDAEYQFVCPCCWQAITLELDLIYGAQSYVEDCQVCCNPIDISYRVSNGEVVDFEAKAQHSNMD